jgi:hypothetical protein
MDTSAELPESSPAMAVETEDGDGSGYWSWDCERGAIVYLPETGMRQTADNPEVRIIAMK